MEHNGHEHKFITKLSANIPIDLLEQLDHLVKENGPFAKRHALHVAALRVGIAELRANPARLHEVLQPREAIGADNAEIATAHAGDAHGGDSEEVAP